MSKKISQKELYYKSMSVFSRELCEKIIHYYNYTLSTYQSDTFLNAISDYAENEVKNMVIENPFKSVQEYHKRYLHIFNTLINEFDLILYYLVLNVEQKNIIEKSEKLRKSTTIFGHIHLFYENLKEVAQK